MTFWAMVISCALLVPAPALAHHGVGSQFDFDTPLELTGTLVRMKWMNPHSEIVLAVKNEDGSTALWRLETVNPGGLERAGLSPKSRAELSPGDRLTVKCYQARDGSLTAFLTDMKLRDGRIVTVWFGNPERESPVKRYGR
jgi:uncharacterized protein DUF6152